MYYCLLVECNLDLIVIVDNVFLIHILLVEAVPG